MFVQSLLFAAVVARGVYLVVAGAVRYLAAPNVLPKWPVAGRAVFHDGVHTYYRALPWLVSNDPLKNSQRLLNLTHRLPVGCHIWTETQCGSHSFEEVKGMISRPDVPLYPSFPRPVLIGGGPGEGRADAAGGGGGRGGSSDSGSEADSYDSGGGLGGLGDGSPLPAGEADDVCVIRETPDRVWGEEPELKDVTDEVRPVYPQIMALPAPHRRMVLREIGVLERGDARDGASVFALDQDMKRIDIA
jgi:hypothetical protein